MAASFAIVSFLTRLAWESKILEFYYYFSCLSLHMDKHLIIYSLLDWGSSPPSYFVYLMTKYLYLWSNGYWSTLLSQLFCRILGSVGMVLVLWSPITLPLLPKLVDSWTSRTPSKIANLACGFGLYIALTILVMMWGKRIRGYENPAKEYGLDLTSWSKVPFSAWHLINMLLRTGFSYVRLCLFGVEISTNVACII